MSITNNGLEDFDEERISIIRDIEILLNLCYENKGHLGDVISCLRTTSSSLNLKADKLNEKFKKQKQDANYM